MVKCRIEMNILKKHRKDVMIAFALQAMFVFEGRRPNEKVVVPNFTSYLSLRTSHLNP